MIYSNKYGYSSSLSCRRDDKFSAPGDGRSGAGPRTTRLSSQKVDFGTDTRNGVFQSSGHHHIASPILSYWIGNNLYGADYCSSFCAAVGDVRGSGGPKNTYLFSHKVYLWLDAGDFASSWSRYASVSDLSGDVGNG